MCLRGPGPLHARPQVFVHAVRRANVAAIWGASLVASAPVPQRWPAPEAGSSAGGLLPHDNDAACFSSTPEMLWVEPVPGGGGALHFRPLAPGRVVVRARSLGARPARAMKLALTRKRPGLGDRVLRRLLVLP